jgi:hypothetical protein
VIIAIMVMAAFANLANAWAIPWPQILLQSVITLSLFVFVWIGMRCLHKSRGHLANSLCSSLGFLSLVWSLRDGVDGVTATFFDLFHFGARFVTELLLSLRRDTSLTSRWNSGDCLYKWLTGTLAAFLKRFNIFVRRASLRSGN